MMVPLPAAFADRMRSQLGSEFPAFLSALEAPALRGIRLNPLKVSQDHAAFLEGERILWAEDAYLLPDESRAGATVLHEAGAWYLQEPSAMLPAAVLAPRPGETILDLCAAPGGKSTQIGAALRGSGLLVCNEPVPKRARVLSGNMERLGIENAVVTCAWPEQLAAKWPEGFDGVLVDAPCSGEGMFRRDPETRKEWSPEKAVGCALRQQEILSAASKLVRPGGRLVYATCTYHPMENEENVRWFLRTFSSFSLEAIHLPGAEAAEGFMTCYPHRLRGEGQFVAAFRKSGEGEARLPEDRSLQKPSREEIGIFGGQFPCLPRPTHRLGDVLVALPFCPDLSGLKVLRAGLHLGEVRGKVASPDHACALSASPPACQAADLTYDQASRYLAGETMETLAEGWITPRYKGLNLGWAKGSAGILKNHYPRGLRGSHFLP